MIALFYIPEYFVKGYLFALFSKLFISSLSAFLCGSRQEKFVLCVLENIGAYVPAVHYNAFP